MRRVRDDSLILAVNTNLSRRHLSRRIRVLCLLDDDGALKQILLEALRRLATLRKEGLELRDSERLQVFYRLHQIFVALSAESNFLTNVANLISLT